MEGSITRGTTTGGDTDDMLLSRTDWQLWGSEVDYA